MALNKESKKVIMARVQELETTLQPLLNKRDMAQKQARSYQVEIDEIQKMIREMKQDAGAEKKRR